MSRPLVRRAVTHGFRTLSLVVFDLVRLAILAAHSRSALVAENMFLRKQLALFQERKVKPRRADDCTRWMMATLSQMFSWRDALMKGGRGESDLGRGTHCQRIEAETRDPGLAPHGCEVPQQ